MFRTEIRHNDLAASRFAVAPLNELVQAFVVLSGFTSEPTLEPWIARIRPRFDQLRHDLPEVDAVATLWSTRGAQPDFMSPPPGRADEPIAEQLQIVRHTSPDEARAQIARSLAESGQRLAPTAAAVLESPCVVDRVTDGLEAAWQELIEPDWLAMHAILQQDLLYRAGLLITNGWAEALADLSPRVRWFTEGETGVIEIPRPGFPDEYHPSDGRGLLFVPTIFRLRVYADLPGPRTMVYTARGKATLAEAMARPTGDPLGQLIGRTRAGLLRALQQPATTTQLTRQHHISLGAAGHHLTALRSSGLIAGTRAGQSVVYRRTELGDALVQANTT